jgi:hypothetical protein
MMHTGKTQLEIRQMLSRLEFDEIYWRGLQQCSTNAAVKRMATTNLDGIRQSKNKLRPYLKSANRIH